MRIKTITGLLIQRETAQVLAAQVSALAGVLAVVAAGSRRDLAQRIMTNVRLMAAALSGDGDAPYDEMRAAAKLDLSGELFEALQSSGVLQKFEEAGLQQDQ